MNKLIEPKIKKKYINQKDNDTSKKTKKQYMNQLLDKEFLTKYFEKTQKKALKKNH